MPTCQVCGKEFQARRGAKTCSGRCRTAASRGSKPKPKSKPKQQRPVAPEPSKDDVAFIREQLALLVAPTHLRNLSEFARRAMYQEAEQLRELIEKANKTQGKQLLALFVRLLKYHAKVFEYMLKEDAQNALAEERARLKQWEKGLEKERKQLAMSHAGMRARIDEKGIKLIQSCLHPDKQPDDKRKARAFDVFRKAL